MREPDSAQVNLELRKGKYGSDTDHCEKTTGFGNAPIKMSGSMLTIWGRATATIYQLQK